MPQLSANDQSKFQTNYATVTPMRKKLQSYDVNFPTKKSSGEKIANETLFPSTPEEEMEQLSMATKLSSMAFEDVPSVTDDTATDAASSTGVTGNSPPVQTRVQRTSLVILAGGGVHKGQSHSLCEELEK